MLVAGVQFTIVWEDPEANFARVTPMIEKAADDGARLVVLPEMFATGFSMHVAALAPHAERIHAFLSDTARRAGVTLVGGVVERVETDGGLRGRNLAVVYGPDGALRASYQKIHPFSYAREHLHYVGGKDLTLVDVEGVRVLPLVCYDLRFPEVFRARAAETDLMLVIANWPSPRRFAWKSLLVARAIENQAYVLGVNAVGTIGKYEYAGDSVLLGPMGERIRGAVQEPAIVLGEVDPGQVRAIRDRFPFLKDRRPEVYRRLEESAQPRSRVPEQP